MDKEIGKHPMLGAETPFARLLRRIGLSRLVLGVVGLLVIVAVLLPPISLLSRLGIVGYETLNADNVAVSHPDGVTLQVDPEAFTERLRVRLDSVPQLAFLEGSAGSELKEAAKALPEHLEIKSPYYKIQTRGTTSQPIWVDVVVPNDAEPWETLDLYTWDGERWTWVGSDLHAEEAGSEFIRAHVTEVPASVVGLAVMQSAPTEERVATYLDSDDDLSQVHLFDMVNPTGLLMGTMGGFAGDVDGLTLPEDSAGCAVLPALRNWAPGGSVNKGLLGDFLDDTAAQETHIGNIVQMCTERGFDGVEIDYRGVAVEQRDAYTSFIGALADALHQEGLRLIVTVERPRPLDGGWETGGYDLAALGQAADVVRVPFPSDSDAYADGGRAHRLLDWATAQVPRYKLMMLVSSLSTTMVEGTDTSRHVAAEEALASFGDVTVLDEVEDVEPASTVALGLSGSLLSTLPQPEAGTYALRYKTDEGDVCTAWLGTAASLVDKLAWAKRYHLAGVTVADALDPGNVDGILDVVAAYPDVETVALPELEDLQIAWTVKHDGQKVDSRSGPLANPSYIWTASEAPGVYTVSASVAGFDHGSLAITVAEPEPEPEPEEAASETITETETMTETAAMTEPSARESQEVSEEAEADCLDAAFRADVTVPDNTQMEKGEAFEKTWRVQNTGSCAWPEDAVLAFIGGEQMGAPETVDVSAVEPGGEEDITVSMEAPAEDGTYTGKWQLRSGETSFGTQLWVKIVIGEPQQTVPAVAPAPPGGGAFELGGHIRDWGFPYADKMHYAGMNWAKVQVRYPGDASGIIAASHANGFKIQVSALGPPDMVTQPGFEQKVADWVAGIAAAGADAIEVWNEPNIKREWQEGYISPQAYTNLLCTAYAAIKNANPGTAVISAAPAPTGWFGGCGPGGCDDLPWLQGMYNAGAAQCMDYIGAHHNAGATSPAASSGHPADAGGGHHSWYFLPQTRLYYNTFGGSRKLFYTEMGYASQEGVPPFSDDFGWARGISNAQQAAWLKEAVQLSINTGMVRCIIVWNIDYVRYGYDPQDGFAIIRPGGGCPACDALHSVLGTR
jgi:spore germination protein YaaH